MVLSNSSWQCFDHSKRKNRSNIQLASLAPGKKGKTSAHLMQSLCFSQDLTTNLGKISTQQKLKQFCRCHENNGIWRPKHILNKTTAYNFGTWENE